LGQAEDPDEHTYSEIRTKIMIISHCIIRHAIFSISKHWWHFEQIFSAQDFYKLFFRGLLTRLDNALLLKP